MGLQGRLLPSLTSAFNWSVDSFIVLCRITPILVGTHKQDCLAQL